MAELNSDCALLPAHAAAQTRVVSSFVDGDKSKGYASTFMKKLYAGDVEKLQKTRGSREAGEAAGSKHARPTYDISSLGQPVMQIFTVDSRNFVVTVLEKQPCTEKGIFMKVEA